MSDKATGLPQSMGSSMEFTSRKTSLYHAATRPGRELAKSTFRSLSQGLKMGSCNRGLGFYGKTAASMITQAIQRRREKGAGFLLSVAIANRNRLCNGHEFDIDVVQARARAEITDLLARQWTTFLIFHAQMDRAKSFAVSYPANRAAPCYRRACLACIQHPSWVTHVLLLPQANVRSARWLSA